MRAFQYRGHFGNGALLQQVQTDACCSPFSSPTFLSFHSFSFLQPPTWIGTASNTSNIYLQSTLQAYFYFYMIAQ